MHMYLPLNLDELRMYNIFPYKWQYLDKYYHLISAIICSDYVITSWKYEFVICCSEQQILGGGGGGGGGGFPGKGIGTMDRRDAQYPMLISLVVIGYFLTLLLTGRQWCRLLTRNLDRQVAISTEDEVINI